MTKQRSQKPTAGTPFSDSRDLWAVRPRRGLVPLLSGAAWAVTVAAWICLPAGGAVPLQRGDSGGANNAEVVRERVKGSVHHPGGKSEWVRIRGRARVVDAHTLEFAEGTRVPLLIVAPDLDQTALIDGKPYPCGREAAEFLRGLIGDKPVNCYLVEEQNKWCGYVGDSNLEHAMITHGWALAHHSGMNPAEIAARENKRGLWRGPFLDPEDWRAGKRLPGERSAGDAALGALRAFDPVVTRDDARPGRPVVSVHFRPNVSQKVSDDDLVHLKRFPGLRSLALPSQNVTDAGFIHLEPLRDLEEINLNWNKVSAAGVLHLLEGRKNLRGLELSGLDLRDDDLLRLQGLTGLERLNLRSTLITDKGVSHLKAFPGLRSLNISTHRGSVTDAGLAPLHALPDLEYLDLDRTAISDAGLAHLKGLRNLRGLQIAQTAVTDAGLEHLRGLPKLSSLNSRGTNVTPEGLDRLRKVQPLLDSGHPGVARRYEEGRLRSIRGKVTVLDAHTLQFADGTEIELNAGMDAPDLAQKGKVGDAFYPCGKEAASFLGGLTRIHEVTFYFEGRGGNKLWGDCFVGETCLQIEMVRNGWAVSHHTGMDSWQMIASESKRGLWRGAFVPPEKWRKGERLPGE